MRAAAASGWARSSLMGAVTLLLMHVASEARTAAVAARCSGCG